MEEGIDLRPMFSIVTVTRNATDVIDRTLASVRAQTCGLYEMIVVDGASTDATLAKVKASGIERLRVVSEPDEGIYFAMNKGLKMAVGDYVIFLNAGDAFHSSDVLQRIADAVFAEDNFPGVVYGQTEIVDNEGRKVSDRHLTAPSVLTWESFRNGMVVCHQAFVALVKVTEPFDTSYRFSADYDWCIKCLKRSRHNLYIDAVLIDYLQTGTTTANRKRSLRERYAIMSRYYGRIPTTLRHAKFLFRFAWNRLRGVKS